MWVCKYIAEQVESKRTYVIGYDQINLSLADTGVISNVTNQLTYDKLLNCWRALQAQRATTDEGE